MLGGLVQLRNDARTLAAAFDADALDGNAAKRAVACAAELERLAVAVKTLAMRRVDVTGAWSTGGERSAERWLSRVSGVSVGEAAGMIAAGEQVERLAATEEALRSGDLSAAQVRLVTEAAGVNPAAEVSLLATAAHASHTKLRDEVLRVKLAAQPPDAQAKIHARRSHRSWIDQDGAYRYDGTNTAANGKLIDGILDAFTDKVFRDARRAGRREARDSYAADAFVRMAEAAGSDGASSEVCTTSRLRGVLVVDAHAYVRGDLEDGERCEIAGLGPIDLESAKQLLGDAVIDIAVTDGVDVKALAHAGRKPTIRQWLALYATGAICSVTGCGERHNLEADHVPEYSITNRTTVGELKLKCGRCHGLKSNHSYVDGPVQPDGTRTLLPPQHRSARAPRDGP